MKKTKDELICRKCYQVKKYLKNSSLFVSFRLHSNDFIFKKGKCLGPRVEYVPQANKANVKLDFIFNFYKNNFMLFILFQVERSQNSEQTSEKEKVKCHEGNYKSDNTYCTAKRFF